MPDQPADFRKWTPNPLVERLLSKELYMGTIKRSDGTVKKALMSKEELKRVRELNRKR